MTAWGASVYFEHQSLDQRVSQAEALRHQPTDDPPPHRHGAAGPRSRCRKNRAARRRRWNRKPDAYEAIVDASGRDPAAVGAAVVLGPPGVGKTRLAVSLRSCRPSPDGGVYYVTLASLMEVKTSCNLACRLKVLTFPALLVVDEIGYRPVTQEARSCSSTSSTPAMSAPRRC